MMIVVACIVTLLRREKKKGGEREREVSHLLKNTFLDKEAGRQFISKLYLLASPCSCHINASELESAKRAQGKKGVPCMPYQYC